MTGPEQRPPADQIGPPACIADGFAMGRQPRPHELFGNRRTTGPIPNRAQVTQPFKPVKIISERR